MSPFAIILAIAAVSGGTLATYPYDERAHPAARLAAGAAELVRALGRVGAVEERYGERVDRWVVPVRRAEPHRADARLVPTRAQRPRRCVCVPDVDRHAG